MDFFVQEGNLWIWQALSMLGSLSLLGFWIFALVDIIQREFRFPHEKLNWILVILLLPPIGMFLYLMNRKTSRRERRFKPDFYSHKKRRKFEPGFYSNRL